MGEPLKGMSDADLQAASKSLSRQLTRLHLTGQARANLAQQVKLFQDEIERRGFQEAGPPEYGSKNIIFTKERHDAALDRIRKRMGELDAGNEPIQESKGEHVGKQEQHEPSLMEEKLRRHESSPSEKELMRAFHLSQGELYNLLAERVDPNERDMEPPDEEEDQLEEEDRLMAASYCADDRGRFKNSQLNEQAPLGPQTPQPESHWKNLGWFLAAVAVISLLALISALLLKGSIWLTAKLFPLVLDVATGAALILIFALLPSALFKRGREWCGEGVVWVSYAWGAALWMWATLLLYQLWGLLGFILGVALLGFGSVPLACIALLFSAKFKLLGEMLLGVVIVFVTRFFGLWITSRAERNRSDGGAWELLPYRWGKFFAVLSGITCVGAVFLGILAEEHKSELAAALAILIALLVGIQTWGLLKRRKLGLIAFYVLCAAAIAEIVLSDTGWGKPGEGFGTAVLYVGSLPYFIRRHEEFE